MTPRTSFATKIFGMAAVLAGFTGSSRPAVAQPGVAEPVFNSTTMLVNGPTNRAPYGDKSGNRTVSVSSNGTVRMTYAVEPEYRPTPPLAVGTIVHKLPGTCTAVVADGMRYRRCGKSWYQPRYAGTHLSYVVVPPPTAASSYR